MWELSSKTASRASGRPASRVAATASVVCALEVPFLSGRVNDLAGVLSASSKQRLEEELRKADIVMLRATDLTPGIGGDVEQSDLPHALEVRPHRVRVESEGLGDLGRDQGPGRAGELEVDRVAGVVAEHLEEIQTRVRASGHESRIHGANRFNTGAPGKMPS